MKSVAELKAEVLDTRGSYARYVLLAYAFVRGRAYRRAEPITGSVSTGFPWHIAHAIEESKAGHGDKSLLRAVEAWLAVPDTPERIAAREAKREAWMQRGREARERYRALHSGAA